MADQFATAPSDEEATYRIKQIRRSLDQLETMNSVGELWEEDVQALTAVTRILGHIVDGDFGYEMLKTLKGLAE